MNTMAYESGQVAGVDQYARHGDRNERRTTAHLGELQEFLGGTVTMDFTVAEDERYAFIARTVGRFGYAWLKWADKAVALRIFLSAAERSLREHSPGSPVAALIRAGAFIHRFG